ncbi:hypothetical protein BDP27DRAFT_1212296 [Rhodocollybia butyracea]|uniref:DH domain-containing protein n=1 Tax=Rhodocollybia butyracea TaxID=206335 RepID=A0A9P5UDT6_9AGAR|nr:hypothetical protein BDP27DRAFT_1212296 [Rhodocollybia butyracea]
MASVDSFQNNVQVRPRSHRVGVARPRSTYDSPFASSPPIVVAPLPPSLPARSPLRPPPARSEISTSPTDSVLSSVAFIKLSTPTSASEDNFSDPTIMPLSFQIRNRSTPSLSGLVDGLPDNDGEVPKSLPLCPDLPLTSSPVEDEVASTSSTSSLGQQPAPIFTKRQHALHELLASERAYASDLALVREIYIPLAIGLPTLTSIPISPPQSQSSASSRLSSASDSSTGSLNAPMSTDDAKIIFNNIAELALFSDLFCDSLQDALGAVVDGGTGEDYVGALFVKTIPDMERPYKQYITRQGTADEHLQSLPKTPALEAYFTQTRTYSTSVSHAWDLHSLLIKPVQRLLKYPLLLGTILDETPDSHPDKQNLRRAKAEIEDLARAVNEERRRAEVVKGVLSGDPKKKLSASNITIAASVNLSKMKSLRRAQTSDNGSIEAARVELMEGELKKIETFAQQLAKDVVGWSKSMTVVMQNLMIWAVSFGKVIGLSENQGSEAFDAFIGLLQQYLGPLCLELETVINERLLKEIALLLATMQQPMKLLESMNEQEPCHYHLLTMNVTAKNRPPPALLEASTNYLALRGQLSKELPRYLQLLHRGIALSIRRLADIQTQFWQDVRDRWGDLWEMLRVDGEMNAGADETIAVWLARWSDVDEVVKSLAITNERKIYQEPLRPAVSPPTPSITSASSSYYVPQSPTQKSLKGNGAASVTHIMHSLDPVHAPVSPPFSLSSPPPSYKSRGRGHSDASKRSRESTESLKTASTKSTKKEKDQKEKKKPKSHPAPDEDWSELLGGLSIAGGGVPTLPLPRAKSMPLSKSTKTTSMSSSLSSSSKLPVIDISPIDDSIFFPEEDRGRSDRKQSFRRKLSETLRSSSKPRSSRPGSSKGLGSSVSSPPPSSVKDDPSFPVQMSLRRDSWSTAKAKYACRVIHPCKPPAVVSYFSFPFFTLVEGDLYQVLQEAGHPSIHPKLPLYVDDGEDCLLLCRNEVGEVGWALASFLEPLGVPML